MRAASACGAGPPGEFASKEQGHQVCRSPSRRVLRGLSARQENLALATGATYKHSEADYSFNAKGLDSQAAEPRPGVVLLGLDAPGPRDSWTEGTPHFHSACYEGALSGIGGLGANPRTQPTPGAGRSFPGSTSTFHASPTNTAIAFPGRAAWSSRRRCASTGGRNNRRRKVRDDVRRRPAPPTPARRHARPGRRRDAQMRSSRL